MPLTTSLGMIEWLEDMPVLKQFYKDNMNKSEECFTETSNKYRNWIEKASAKRNRSSCETYALGLNKYSKDATVANYSLLVNTFPSDTLRYVSILAARDLFCYYQLCVLPADLNLFFHSTHFFACK